MYNLTLSSSSSSWPPCSHSNSWETSWTDAVTHTHLRTHTFTQLQTHAHTFKHTSVHEHAGRPWPLLNILHSGVFSWQSELCCCSVWAWLHKHITVSQINLQSFMTIPWGDSWHCHTNEGFPFFSPIFSSLSVYFCVPVRCYLSLPIS